MTTGKHRPSPLGVAGFSRFDMILTYGGTGGVFYLLKRSSNTPTVGYFWKYPRIPTHTIIAGRPAKMPSHAYPRIPSCSLAF